MKNPILRILISTILFLLISGIVVSIIGLQPIRKLANQTPALGKLAALEPPQLNFRIDT